MIENKMWYLFFYLTSNAACAKQSEKASRQINNYLIKLMRVRDLERKIYLPRIRYLAFKLLEIPCTASQPQTRLLKTHLILYKVRAQ